MRVHPAGDMAFAENKTAVRVKGASRNGQPTDLFHAAPLPDLLGILARLLCTPRLPERVRAAAARRRANLRVGDGPFLAPIGVSHDRDSGMWFRL